MKGWSGILTICAIAIGCGGTPIRYYQPQLTEAELRGSSSEVIPLTLSVASFTADLAYDDQRIVYRQSDQRFDYYHFHRWSSSPGEMASVILRETYRHTGRFAHVVGGLDPRADVVLGGRVVALEEVDVSKKEWQVRVTLELTLRDAVTGAVLWSELVEEREPVAEQTPAGVAASAGRALTRIGARTTPLLAGAAKRATGKR